MRTILLKLKPDTERALKTMQARYNLANGWVQDIYALILMRGRGIPNDDLTRKIIAHHSKVSPIASVLVRRRIATLKVLMRSSLLVWYFGRLKSDPKLTNRLRPLRVVDMLLEKYIAAYGVVQEVQCMSCGLTASCQFGQKYGKRVNDVSKVTDPDWETLVHASCPTRPEIEAQNKLMGMVLYESRLMQSPPATKGAMRHSPKALYDPDEQQKAAKVAKVLEAVQEEIAKEEAEVATEPDAISMLNLTDDREGSAPMWLGEDGGCIHDGDDREASERHVPGSKPNENPLVLASMLEKEQLVLFNIALRLEAAVGRKTKELDQKNPSGKKEKREQMEVVSDVVKAPEELSAEDDVLARRVARKEIVVKHKLAPEHKRPCCVVLVDVSYSMREPAGLNPLIGNLTKCGLATALALALFRNAKKSNGVAALFKFDGLCRLVAEANDAATFDLMMDATASLRFDGSTDLVQALHHTIDYVKVQRETHSYLSHAEIVVLTDAQDAQLAANVQAIKDKARIADVRINTVLVENAWKGSTSAAATEFIRQYMAELQIGGQPPPIPARLTNPYVEAIQKISDAFYPVNPEATTLDGLVTVATNRTARKP